MDFSQLDRHQKYNVLFLCEDNAARSLMAEAMMQHMGHNHFNAYSAGLNPASEANPVALEVLTGEGFVVDKLQPKHWHNFTCEGAPEMDFVFTLCDKTRDGAELGRFAGDPVTAHWHFDDPHKESEPAEQRKAFSKVQRELANRMRLFLSLPNDHIDRMSLHHHFLSMR